MRKALLVSLLLAVAIAPAATARVLMSQRQALAAAFPAGTQIVRQTYFLTHDQMIAAQRESGVDFSDALLVRYAGKANGKVVGYAYFDTHRVRTLPETVMVVVTPDGRIEKVEILSFDEPTDYFPKRRWIDQFLGRRLDPQLSLNAAIRPISGASLTGRALVNASRKVLGIHHAIGDAAPHLEAPAP